MSDARLPIQYRDSCGHLLIPLNKCRVSEYYLPWKCEVSESAVLFACATSIGMNVDLRTKWMRKQFNGEKMNWIELTMAPKQNERHSYEKCQYDEFKKRVAKMDELRAAKGGARSN